MRLGNFTPNAVSASGFVCLSEAEGSAESANEFKEQRPERLIQALGWGAMAMAYIPSIAILLESVTPLPITAAIEQSLGSICHHQPERTIILNAPWTVCARCSGLYCGWLLAVLCLWRMPSLSIRCPSGWFRGVLKTLFATFVFGVGAAALEAWEWIAVANWPRFILGIPLGLFPAFSLLAVGSTLATHPVRHRLMKGGTMRMRFCQHRWNEDAQDLPTNSQDV